MSKEEDEFREAVIRIMNRPGWRGTWDDAVKQLNQENVSWAKHKKEIKQ